MKFINSNMYEKAFYLLSFFKHHLLNNCIFDNFLSNMVISSVSVQVLEEILGKNNLHILVASSSIVNFLI